MICPLPRANEFDVAYHTFKSNKFETIHIIAFYNFMYLSRVRTGYGILEKLWNFEKEIPYMEKLWNLNKTAVLMEKLWNFRFGGKNECLLKKKTARKYVQTSKCGFNVCCFGYHFTRPSSTNLPGYSASL